MSQNQTHLKSAVVIGGGFYGSRLAIRLATRHRMKVVLLEAGSRLLDAASRLNQARVHTGGHYPRAFQTAYRSQISAHRFRTEYPDAVKSDFTQLYAVPKLNSKVTARQFFNFCQRIGAGIRPAASPYVDLFDPRRIERVFEVDEWAFDATVLREHIETALNDAGVQVELMTTGVITQAEGNVGVMTEETLYRPDLVVNCSYARIAETGVSIAAKVKIESTELAMLRMPEPLANVGITIMDGPFWSAMPYPARPGLHTLSHVKYTPRSSWLVSDDERDLDPPPRQTRSQMMIADAARFVPSLAEATYVDSHFTNKAVLLATERDDARPILFERDRTDRNIVSILGGKLDNIYDAETALDDWVSEQSH